MRDQMKAVAWVFIASPIAIAIFGDGRYGALEAAFLPVVGLLMLAFYRWRPLPDPEHLASVEYVVPANDYDGPDALTTPFYLAWCDCGWNGDDQPDEQSARAEARRHTEHVRPELHAFDE
jgi:hypothetical protein